jgi:ABC-type Fe3+ transport system permease subunit
MDLSALQTLRISCASVFIIIIISIIIIIFIEVQNKKTANGSRRIVSLELIYTQNISSAVCA